MIKFFYDQPPFGQRPSDGGNLFNNYQVFSH